MVAALGLALTMTGCDDKSRKTPLPDREESIGAAASELSEPSASEVQRPDVKARVEQIYDAICKLYNASDEEMQNLESIDRNYCSAAWNEALERVGKPKTAHVGDAKALNYDYWIQAQDWEHVSYKEVKLVSMSGDDKAQVELLLVNGRDFKVTLTLVYERDNWYVDDLADEAHPDGIRRTMEE